MKAMIRSVSLMLCLVMTLTCFVLTPSAGAVTVIASGDDLSASSSSSSSSDNAKTFTVGAVVVAAAILLWVGWRSNRDPHYMGNKDKLPVSLPTPAPGDKVATSFFADLGPAPAAVGTAPLLAEGETEWLSASVGWRVRF